MIEEWKYINNSDHGYQISNLGNIKRDIQLRKQEPSVSFNHDGYKMTSIRFNGKWKAQSIARLVAQSFLPNPDNLPEVNHIDSDRTNNHILNLEWCTHQENILHSHRCGNKSHVGEKNTNSKLSASDVLEIRNRFEAGERQVDIASIYGLTRSGIYSIVHRRTWEHI